ncbi:MAG TPA: hypothetical protein VIX13_01310 [Candidatus Eisenbacteria bacterium]
MLRSILYALSILLALRFVSVIARMITAGKRPGPRIDEEPQDRGGAPPNRERPSRPRVQRSDAVDVPFTDIPPDSPPPPP